jgi:HSP20 family molecular chaperone IbpA
MTHLKPFDTQSLANLNRALVGFDRLFNSNLNIPTNYPPYNIVKFDEHHYGIEVAVAGFTEKEITVQVDQDQLMIRGKSTGPDVSREYLHRGLASRDFEQTFTLAEYMEVSDAEIKNGMLRINIERVIPEALKPRQIAVKLIK